MLLKAMDNFQVAKRQHKENQKAQYLDMTGQNGEKTFFRASELGYGDRKIIYGFFAHQLPKKEKSARNLRQLENGDYVHERYQKAWEEMGCLLSKEQRVSSKEDEVLSEFPWEWAGHYDGELDLNIIRAHALGLAKVESVLNEETGEYEIIVEIDEEYANEIGLFDENGDISKDYEPLRMVVDIKTMNPWAFKRLKEEGDVSAISGYIDQISFYMYMRNTPYGCIYIENKENNDILEVQIVWKDLHEGVEYEFTEDIHGEQTDEQLRVTIDSGRFFGDETREGVVPRIDRLWKIVQGLKEADVKGDFNKIAELMPKRCSDKPDAFPCSWGHRKGKVETCEFFEHCWSDKHKGLAVREWEPCPPEAIWSFEDDNGNLVQIDSRKVPEGVDQDGFLKLVEMGVLDYTKFLVDGFVPGENEETAAASEESSLEEAIEEAVNTNNLFTGDGELKLSNPEPPSEAAEYVLEDGQRAIKCSNCGKEVVYRRLNAGSTKKCPFCQHVNKVIKFD